MGSHQTVLLTVKNKIAFVSLNRPEKHNGLDKNMMDELVGSAKAIRKNKSIRAVVISGEGASFCAGLDFSYVSKNPSIIPKYFIKLPWGRDNMFQRVANIWRDIPVPVIASIHGNCFGGGMQIILACDYRISMPDAQLSIMEMKYGLIPDMSGMVNLSRLTRVDIAQELSMTGRVFTGEDGAQYGIISRTSTEPMEEATRLAQTIADQSPDAIAATKYLFKKTWKKDARGALLWERITQLRLLGRKNQRIAMKNGLSDKENKPFMDRTSFR